MLYKSPHTFEGAYWNMPGGRYTQDSSFMCYGTDAECIYSLLELNLGLCLYNRYLSRSLCSGRYLLVALDTSATFAPSVLSCFIALCSTAAAASAIVVAAVAMTSLHFVFGSLRCFKIAWRCGCTALIV